MFPHLGGTMTSSFLRNLQTFFIKKNEKPVNDDIFWKLTLKACAILDIYNAKLAVYFAKWM